MKEISNEEIKKAIIENVTYRTSRDNNKNNIRIKKFLNTAYPDLIIFFEVDKRTGNVSVSGYENYEQWKIKQDEKEKKFNEEYMEMNRRAEQVARFAKRYSTPEGKERLEKSIKKRFGRDGIKAIANFEIINKYASSIICLRIDDDNDFFKEFDLEEEEIGTIKELYEIMKNFVQ